MTGELAAFEGRIAIVGSGIAGLMTALELAPEPVVLLTKYGLGLGTSSAWAQGGIAASLGSDDSVGFHLADTRAAGGGHCDERAAATIIGEAQAAIDALESWGVAFDRNTDGNFALGLEAAHSHRRIVHAAGDGTGVAIVRALARAVAATPSITVLEGADVRRLLTSGGRIAGLVGKQDGQAFSLRTTRVVLATGGVGGLYDATTNPPENFGQGIALAARAGAVLADMEFVQFHPTALALAKQPLPLISEAVRGEGALLVNERGDRFMADTPGLELAPRDVVARAIGAQIERGGRVFLDARNCGVPFDARFPAISKICRQNAIDPTTEPIPVCPAAHYHMGGVATDLSGRSSVTGLWAVGEVACTGLHGANRLASNSLLEATVMGLRVARDLLSSPIEPGRPSLAKSLLAGRILLTPESQKVRRVASRHLGIVRQGSGIEEAIATLLPWAEGFSPATDPATVGLLIAVFAHLRQESRGAHARSDFPNKQPVGDRTMLTLSEVLDLAWSIVPQDYARSA
ncbi:L-aspartate oxidase [Rhizobium sp. KVB221]|uniref:L-aspartate oxidase n=1 Tax=Rhizobium setariae TaxID=2801340 RepID=A0A937CNG9_9HYPH|nr:L-aspartate oxidase [Rhizobium setariae]MBL0373731.1 L-aspartate oxidase [Rhizobium setariae]